MSHKYLLFMIFPLLLVSCGKTDTDPKDTSTPTTTIQVASPGTLSGTSNSLSGAQVPGEIQKADAGSGAYGVRSEGVSNTPVTVDSGSSVEIVSSSTGFNQ